MRIVANWSTLASRTSTISIGFLLGVLLLPSCNVGPDGRPQSGVRIVGGIPQTVRSVKTANSGNNMDGRSARSLIAQSLSITAVLANSSESLEESSFTEPVEEDGTFSLDIQPGSTDANFIVYAQDPTRGVGLQNLVGFLEIPAGSSESSANWPMGGTPNGTLLELGTLAEEDGSLVTRANLDDLYSSLQIDLDEFIFLAGRDNSSKFVINDSLNSEADFYLTFINLSNHLSGDVFTNARNQWSTETDVIGQSSDEFGFGINFDSDTWDWNDFADGSNVFTITPPGEIWVDRAGEIVFGPDQPINSDEFWPNGGVDGGFNGQSFYRSPPDGLWTFEINGELDAVFDLSFSNPYRDETIFLYYVPLIYIATEEDSGIVREVRLKMRAYDFSRTSYVDIPSAELPFELSLCISATGYNECFDGLGDSTFAIPSEEIRYEDLRVITHGYFIGQLSIDFGWEFNAP